MISLVEIESLDRERITEVTGAGPDIYGIYIKLKDVPKKEWRNLFTEVWEKTDANLFDRPSLIDNEIQIKFKYGENIQVKVNFIKTVIEETNKLALKRNENERLRQERIKEQEKEKIEKLVNLKEQLKNLTI